MIENINYRGIPTTLNLNGPVIDIVRNLSDVESFAGGQVTVGVAVTTLFEQKNTYEINHIFDNTTNQNIELTYDSGISVIVQNPESADRLSCSPSLDKKYYSILFDEAYEDSNYDIEIINTSTSTAGGEISQNFSYEIDGKSVNGFNIWFCSDSNYNSYIRSFTISTIKNFSAEPADVSFKWFLNGTEIFDSAVDSNSNISIASNQNESNVTISGLTIEDDNTEIYAVIEENPLGNIGNAYNEPLKSRVANIKVTSVLEFLRQPIGDISAQGDTSIFEVSAHISPLPEGETSNISYQWQYAQPSEFGTQYFDLIDGIRDVVGSDTTPKLSVATNDGQKAYSSWVYHVFNNSSDTHTITNNSSDIEVQYLNPGAPDGLSCTNNTSAKYYRIIFRDPFINSDYQVRFDSISSNTAGGGYGRFTASVANKTANGFDVWFCRNSTFNSYIREFSFSAIGIKEYVETIDLSPKETLSYDKFIPGGKYTIESEEDVDAYLTLKGAGGGKSSTRDVSGGSGGLSEGKITFKKGQKYILVVGGAGSDGINGGAGGYSGGGNGGTGYGKGGGGGGYTGLFLNSVSLDTSIIIAAGGGGGNDDPSVGGDGGGTEGTGSGGRNGKGGTQSFGGAGGFVDGIAGSAGSSLQGGSGGAGGGGGYYGGGGGQSYPSCCAGGSGGGGSGYADTTLIKNSKLVAGFGGSPSSNGSFKIEFIPKSVAIKEFNISGSKTNRLEMSSNTIGTSSIRCLISTTDNRVPQKFLGSNEVNFTVVAPRNIINVERYRRVSNPDEISNAQYMLTITKTYNFDLLSSAVDITLGDDYIFVGDKFYNFYPIACFYSPEKNQYVEMELWGGAGVNLGKIGSGGSVLGQALGSGEGGRGGYSKIRFNMEKNVEYIASVVNGESIFIFKKERLMAVVGGGGNANFYGGGGAGGGVRNSGEDAFGGAKGGQFLGGSDTTISTSGIFGSYSRIRNEDLHPNDSKATSNNGGRTLRCSRGTYYSNEGLFPCESIGNQVNFADRHGNIYLDSASISRGYKDGYNIFETAGKGEGIGGHYGRGGYGATGGQGGFNRYGGGGGSGYYTTEVPIEILESVVGGNTNSESHKLTIKSVAPSVNEYYIDEAGRILILSCTQNSSPLNLTKTTGAVRPGTNTCIDDARWQSFLELARTYDYRLTATLDGKTSKVTNATPTNIRRMINANNIALQTSLTGWIDTNYSYKLYALVWDENNTSGGRGYGSDYSILSWSTSYGFGYYGESSNSFFTPTAYNTFSANWWILPPGVPDFS